MSDVLFSYTCVFTYDDNHRIVKFKKTYERHCEMKEIIYEDK